jgi:hypothetical protein
LTRWQQMPISPIPLYTRSGLLYHPMDIPGSASRLSWTMHLPQHRRKSARFMWAGDRSSKPTMTTRRPIVTCTVACLRRMS